MFGPDPWLLASTFFICLIGLSLTQNHFLSALLCLEGMVLSIFIGLCLWSFKNSITISTIFPLITLTMSACEAAMGLGLMIAAARTHDTDQLKAINLLQC